ncbi:MAG TPA: hypothetical protein VIV11_18285 [Kofleriaceae bacterium]
MRDSAVHRAMHELAKDLEEAGIPYAIVGAMALNEHGYERVTTDVDVLLTREGLAAFKERFLGRGYVEKFAGSKAMRNTRHNVSIDVLLTGDYPGDGKPKPISFPDPAQVAERGVRFSLLPIPRQLELKLASGISAPHRMKDLADVLEWVKHAKLPRELADQLDPYVRDKFLELWDLAQTPDPIADG